MTAAVWPADRFFWAVLDAPGVRGGIVPATLEPALQDELPFDVGDVHAVGTPLSGGRLLVCALPRDELAAIPEDVLSLRTVEVPADLCEDPAVEPPDMLIGEFQPKVLRRELSRRTTILAAGILLCSGLVSVGLLRRAGHLSQDAEAMQTSVASALKNATESGTHQALAQELDRLHAASTVDQSLSPKDAAQSLAKLLRAWPKDADCEASDISIGPELISLSLFVRADPRSLLNDLKAPEGWVMDEPRFSTSAGVTRVGLTFSRAKEHGL